MARTQFSATVSATGLTRLAVRLLATSALVALPGIAAAQTTVPAPSEEIIVTAQKRSENLQNVPISIQAFGTRKLDQLNVANFNDYARMLPSVTFQTSQPGTTNVYMRGVASGGDGNHSGPLPSVGVYLDEQPVTTIGGALDVHVYDIARIESLAGPQGTLYGASSEAGTIRIITNKPSTAGFEGRVDGEINTVTHGGIGGKLEGMVNAPLGQRAALRIVGWYQHNAGYIDNVAGTRSFLPQPGGITVNNAAYIRDNYNTVDIAGGRAALKIDLDDNWTVTPTVIAQDQRSRGRFGYDPRVGDLKVQAFYPERFHDRFVQAALTIQGKLSNWDVTYAGAYLDRRIDSQTDYTDYSEAYDQLYAAVGGMVGNYYFKNNAGNVIDSRQTIAGYDHFTKLSQEFRVASPATDRFRVVGGLFYQRQTHFIHQDYQVPNLSSAMSVNGFPGTLWLTQQDRIDRDYAMFGEMSYDILPNLTLTAGGRAFIYDNSLIGFFGFGRDPNGPPWNAAGSSRTGVAGCFTSNGDIVRNGTGGTILPPVIAGSPCTNLGTFIGNGQIRPKIASGEGFTHRLNLTWKASPNLMLYGTWSRGFRPGGINRRGTIPPYAPDYLTNFEVGFKASALDRKLKVNAAVFTQDWKSFQYAFLGANSFTEVHNGPDARIKGVEADISFAPGNGLTLSTSLAYTDATIRKNLCGYDDPSFACTALGPDGQINYVAAPAGTRLPVTPQFKISGTARYEFDLGSGAKAHLQAVASHQSSASSDIRTRLFNNVWLNDSTNPAVAANPANYFNPAALTGRLKAFSTIDFAAGIEWSRISAELFVQNAFDERGELSRFQQCGVCFQRPYIVTNTPQTFGLRLGSKF